MSFSGMFGRETPMCRHGPARVRSRADRESLLAIKLIVVNTEGVERPDGGDSELRRGCFERCLLGCLTCILPPHADNVATSRYLHQNALETRASFVRRPSNLTNVEPVSATVRHCKWDFRPWVDIRANVTGSWPTW